MRSNLPKLDRSQLLRMFLFLRFSGEETLQHIGEAVTLYDSVTGAEHASASNGKPTFIDISVASYRNKNRL